MSPMRLYNNLSLFNPVVNLHYSGSDEILRLIFILDCMNSGILCPGTIVAVAFQPPRHGDTKSHKNYKTNRRMPFPITGTLKFIK